MRTDPANNGANSRGTARHDSAIVAGRSLKLESEVLERAHAPPPSAPRATGQRPAQTAAADPLDEPPDTLPVW